MPPKGSKGINTSALGAISGSLDFLGADTPQTLAASGLQVEYIHIEMIRPDPANPRRVLPQHIYETFHNQQIRPEQALRQFVEYTKQIAKQHGRGFGSLMDLLPSTADEIEETGNLTPEEVTLRDLVILADTLRNDNQVNPITVVEIRQQGGTGRTFLIETGERRYWATWILRELPGYDGDGTIPCLNVTGRQSVFRAARENTSRAGLNAIATARQIAILLLNVYGIEPPMGPVPNDWYRQALDLDLRGKREYTAEILSSMGGMHRRDFSRYKALLQLSDAAMEMADRYQMEERKLRPLVDMPPDAQTEILQQALGRNWDSRQIEAACNKWRVGEFQDDDTVPKLPVPARQIARVAFKSIKPEDIAAAFIEEEPDVELVLGRLRSLRKLLQDAEQLILSNE